MVYLLCTGSSRDCLCGKVAFFRSSGNNYNPSSSPPSNLRLKLAPSVGISLPCAVLIPVKIVILPEAYKSVGAKHARWEKTLVATALSVSKEEYNCQQMIYILC